MDEYEKLTNSLGRIRNYEKSILLMNINYPSVDLKKFTQLESIRFEECRINNFVNAPKTLKKLCFIQCIIYKFENLPENLESIEIIDCRTGSNDPVYIELDNLPKKLKKLQCSNTSIKSFNNLPTGLEILNCDGTQEAIEYLPAGLKKLYCKAYNVTRLDFLPNTLEELYCAKRLENLNEIKQTYPNLKIDTTSNGVWF